MDFITIRTIGEIVIIAILWCYLSIHTQKKWGKVTFHIPHSGWFIKFKSPNLKFMEIDNVLTNYKDFASKKPDWKKRHREKNTNKLFRYFPVIKCDASMNEEAMAYIGRQVLKASSTREPKISHKNFLYCVLCVLNKMQCNSV